MDTFAEKYGAKYEKAVTCLAEQNCSASERIARRDCAIRSLEQK